MAGYPLPPKEISRTLNESDIQKAPQIRAEYYEVLDSFPRLHGGLYFDSKKKRLRILDPKAQSVLVYDAHRFLAPKRNLSSGERFQVPNTQTLEEWVYPDSLLNVERIVRHPQGRFKANAEGVFFVPEDLNTVFWGLKSDWNLVGVKTTLKTKSLLAWSLFPAGFWYLPPQAIQALQVSYKSGGEFLNVMDCPDGERFVVSENYRDHYFRFIFLTESFVPLSYALFEVPNSAGKTKSLTTGVTHLGDCKNFIAIGSWGLARIRFK